MYFIILQGAGSHVYTATESLEQAKREFVWVKKDISSGVIKNYTRAYLCKSLGE
jgi:hypothetical protein